MIVPVRTQTIMGDHGARSRDLTGEHKRSPESMEWALLRASIGIHVLGQQLNEAQLLAMRNRLDQVTPVIGKVEEGAAAMRDSTSGFRGASMGCNRLPRVEISRDVLTTCPRKRARRAILCEIARERANICVIKGSNRLWEIAPHPWCRGAARRGSAPDRARACTCEITRGHERSREVTGGHGRICSGRGRA